MILYDYWRSSAAYRVRIALNLKGIPYQSVPVNLIKEGGQQHSADYAALNPNELVPVLVDGEVTLNQSLTIIDYLDEHYAGPQLTPSEGKQRYLVKALAQDIAIDIHPINNLRVIQQLNHRFDIDERNKVHWMQHWINTGFAALEQKLAPIRGIYCVGYEVSLVDVCLVPQVYNALRFGVDMSAYPNIDEIAGRLNELDAFQRAAPDNQNDAT
ncbi:maleylacetoacetate isomerase [Vibrio wakamikoensis]|uniref:Maleylacetoacetate isomerase n=1 Tax=Vibrio chaetopteri TaxID=3016528 RepID=A0AAU8BMS1_9VIBR